MVEFYMRLPAENIAQQVADLLNTHNKLYKMHTADTILRDPAKYFLEISGDMVVGCQAIMKEEPRLSKMFHLCVHSDFRRKGIARKLKQAALDNVETPYIYVTIREDNIPSLNLNYSFGFVFVKNILSKDHNVIMLGRAV